MRHAQGEERSPATAGAPSGTHSRRSTAVALLAASTVGLAGCAAGTEIRLLPHTVHEQPTRLPTVLPAALPPPPPCAPKTVSADLGRIVTVARCHGDWAYVSSGELGDAQSLARLVDGRWSVYTGFPSSTCRDRAAADGVPGPELRSFPPC